VKEMPRDCTTASEDADLFFRNYLNELLCEETDVYHYVRFQFLMVASMKMTAFLDVVPCSLGADRQFRGAYFLHHQYHNLMEDFLETYANTCLRKLLVVANES
jgi:hypothetical protein